MTDTTEQKITEAEIVRVTAIRGMIEIMINPEVGSEWLKELMAHAFGDGVDITDEMGEQADDLMVRRFYAFAAELANELPEEQRSDYDDALVLYR